LLESGTTTVADIEAVPELLPEVWTASTLRIFSFLEMTGVRSRRDPAAILAEVEGRIASLSHTRVGLGPSPHAPYSTTPRLLELTAATSQRHRWLVCTHVAESAEEFEMFTAARGVMFDWLARNERDNSDCGQGTPIQHLAKHGLINSRFLAIHANYLTAADIAQLAAGGAHVVHCPRSHAYFQHQRFLLEPLVAAGVNVCLGTDSLATTLLDRGKLPRLDMFAELQQFGRAYPDLPPDHILRLATVNGAKALHMAGQAGELTPGALADVVAIPATPRLPDCHEAILNHAGPMQAVMINGAWAIAPAT
jgi:cytosine/adenosine deaminase-related metal-dependent hydrolase